MVTNTVMVAAVGVVVVEVFLSEQSHLKEVELYRLAHAGFSRERFISLTVLLAAAS